MSDQQPSQTPEEPKKELRLPSWGLPAVLDRFEGNGAKLYVTTIYLFFGTLGKLALFAAVAHQMGWL